MAYCSKCGAELTEGAKFCPKCGEQVNQQSKPNEQPNGQLNSLKEDLKEGWQEEIKSENESNNQDQTKGLSTGVKIALAVAGFFALTGILGGLSDGMWIACIVSLCAMGAICAVFMGKIQIKYAWTTAIVSLLVVMCTIGASLPDEENGKEKQVQAEQKQETPIKEQESAAERQAREQKEAEKRQALEQQEKENKKKERLEEAYQEGYEKSMKQTYYMERGCLIHYTAFYGAPKSQEDFDFFKQYKAEYDRGWNDGKNAQRNM